MAANVSILVWHGVTASRASTALTNGQAIRYKQADNDTVDLNNKIPITAGQTTYSFVKNFQFSASTSPSNTIDTLTVYSDGANGLGTGVDLMVKSSATYVDPITLGAAQMTAASSIFGYTSGSPLAITGSLNNPTTGAFGNFIATQLVVQDTASPGTTPSETITFSYDES